MQKFRNRSFLFVGFLGIGIAVALTVADWHLISDPADLDAVFRLPLYIGIALLCWRFMLWPRISATTQYLTIRNPLRTHRVPWPAVQGFRAEDRVVVELAGGSEIRCWAVQRANLASMLNIRSHVDNVVTDLEEIRAERPR